MGLPTKQDVVGERLDDFRDHLQALSEYYGVVLWDFNVDFRWRNYDRRDKPFVGSSENLSEDTISTDRKNTNAPSAANRALGQSLCLEVGDT
jgi:hypothetical protein